jgi:hypothetical protein
MSSVAFDPSRLARIAGWTLKTAIMVDAYESRTWDNPPHAPRSEIEFLYVHGVPSTHSAIWVGLMAAPYSSFSPPQNLAPRYGSDLEWNVPDAAWMPVHAVHQWCSLVACQVDGSGWLVDLPEELSPYFVRIWPPREAAVSWPPPHIIDRPTYEPIVSMRQAPVPDAGKESSLPTWEHGTKTAIPHSVRERDSS